MGKDYSDWNGRKRQLQNLAAKKEAAQQPDRLPKGKRAKRGKELSVKHRLDKAESLICDMASCIDRLMATLYRMDPEISKEVGTDINHKWWMLKYTIRDAERLLELADKTVEAAIKRNSK
jgi:hypothetical protein